MNFISFLCNWMVGYYLVISCRSNKFKMQSWSCSFKYLCKLVKFYRFYHKPTFFTDLLIIRRLFNYLIVQIAPICLSTIEWKTYIIFIATNTSFVSNSTNYFVLFRTHSINWKIPLIYFLFPETKGHSLEELDRIFNKAHFEKRNPVYVEKEWRKLYGINTFLEDEEKPKVQHIEDRRFNDTDSNSS